MARYFTQKGMDMKTMIIRVLTCVAVSLFAITTMAQTPTGTGGAQPGMVGTAKTIKITATVTAVDKATRDVTLKGPQGNELTVTAGPEVKNFDAIKVGDMVNATYKQALTVELKKGGGAPVARTESQGAMKMNSGETVPGTLGRRVTVTADVVAVDPATQVVTLRGPRHTVDMVVSDPEQFKRVAKGDQVEVTYIQALAAALEPAK